MREVTVDRVTLAEKVKANRDQHKAIFDEAVDGYQREAIRMLEEHISNIRSGKIFNAAIALPVPVNHVRDYDRVLTMLEMHQGETIRIDDDSFAQYVMDDWHWKRQFLSTNSAYSATAMGQFRAADGTP